MSVYNQYNKNGLNHLSGYTASLFRDSLIPSLIVQQKKICAIAIFAIGLFVIFISSFIKKGWIFEKKGTNNKNETPISNKNETPISKTETYKIKDNIPHEHEMVKAKEEFNKITTNGHKVAQAKTKTSIDQEMNKVIAEALKIKTQIEEEVLKIKKDVELTQVKALAIITEAEAKAKEIEAGAQSLKEKVEALSNKDGNNLNENEEALKTQPIDEVNPLGKSLSQKIAFGKEQWTKYFGEIGNELALPKDIQKILESPCPFFPDKKVEETHLLVLIPETINGKSLNLDTLGKLVGASNKGFNTKYSCISPDVINTVGQQATPKSHWVLMTKDVIEGSRGKSYESQQTLIANVNKQKGLNYEIPNGLDATICIFMHYVRSQERLFNENPCTYTRCQEYVENCPLTIGFFSSSGLFVLNTSLTNNNIGVAALRKFF